MPERQVPERQPVDSAVTVARTLLGRSAQDARVPSRKELLAAVRDFEHIEFDVPEAPESDGFLFQFGVVNWLPEPTFVLGFVRQFEIVDAGGEYEGYSQLQLEYHYPVDAEIEAAGRGEKWWFRGEPVPFETWLDSVERDPVWQILSGKNPSKFDISQELV